MKRQLLCVTLACFALGAMEKPITEKEKQGGISQKMSNVPSLKQLCVSAVATQIDVEKAKRDFKRGEEIEKPNIPAELQPLIASKLIKEHPLIPSILFRMKFDSSVSDQLKQELLKEGEWLPCDAIENSKRADWYNPEGNRFVRIYLDVYSTAFTAYIYSIEKNEETLIGSLPVGYVIRDVAWSPDSSKIALLPPAEPYFEIWDIKTEKLYHYFITHQRAQRISWSQDGQTIKLSYPTGERFVCLSNFLTREKRLKAITGAYPDSRYIESAILLMLAHDMKPRGFSRSGLDISNNQMAKEILSSLDKEVQRVLIYRYKVIAETQPQESNCLIS